MLVFITICVVSTVSVVTHNLYFVPCQLVSIPSGVKRYGVGAWLSVLEHPAGEDVYQVI